MGMLRRIRDALLDPRLVDVDVDGSERLHAHRQILREKPLLRQVYEELYELCRRLDERYLDGTGARIEIGSGTSLMKRRYPEVLRSDLIPAPDLDLVLDAQRMAFADASIRAVYGIHTFHHLRDRDAFFSELDRVLIPGGGLVLIEPYFGPAAGLLFPRMFDSEGFDKRQIGWPGGDEEPMGPLSGANQALSYIVFRRELDSFQRRYPRLAVVCRRRIHNYLRYLASGGLNFHQLVPTWAAPALRVFELSLAPVSHLTALHWAVVLRKTPPIAETG